MRCCGCRQQHAIHATVHDERQRAVQVCKGTGQPRVESCYERRPASHSQQPAGLAIAEALRLNYVFLSEFEEIHSPLRDARTQVGPKQFPLCRSLLGLANLHFFASSPHLACCPTQGGGVHGNAILTKFDITEVAVVPHRCGGSVVAHSGVAG